MNEQKIKLLQPYDPVWEMYFYQEKKWLLHNLNLFTIHHVGSTSIEGLMARPIIDIFLEVESLPAFSSNIEHLKQSGYQQRNGHFFKATNHAKLLGFCLYIFTKDEAALFQKLAFFDYLKAFEKERKRYASMKKNPQRKQAFFEEVTPIACKWKQELELLYPKIQANALIAASFPKEVNLTTFRKANLIQSPNEEGNFVYGSDIEPDDLSAILDAYQKHSSMKYWVLPWDRPRNLCNLLEKQGFILKKVEEGMLLRTKNIPERLNKVEIVLAQTATELQEFSHIQSSDLLNQYEKSVPNEHPNVRRFLGRVEGRAVTALTWVETKDLAGIYGVVTLPSERNKGYASSLIVEIIKKACIDQVKLVFLQASFRTEKWYQSLGFQRFSSFYEYKRYL